MAASHSSESRVVPLCIGGRMIKEEGYINGCSPAWSIVWAPPLHGLHSAGLCWNLLDALLTAGASCQDPEP